MTTQTKTEEHPILFSAEMVRASAQSIDFSGVYPYHIGGTWNSQIAGRIKTSAAVGFPRSGFLQAQFHPCGVGSGISFYAMSKVKVTCDHCGQSFLRYSSKLKDKDNHYCSRECSDAGKGGWTDREIHTLRSKYQELTNGELGDLIGRSRNAVACKLRRLGLQRSPEAISQIKSRVLRASENAYDVSQHNEKRKVDIPPDEIRRMYASGQTIAEIADRYGVSVQPIKRIMKENGIERRAAVPRPGKMSGPNNPAWKGGRRIRTDGYVIVWTPNGPQLEHRVVMEEELGRKLSPDEIVHHIDGDRSNNTPSNLVVMTQSEHIQEHIEEMNEARHGNS